MSVFADLPIHPALPALEAALAERTTAVLVAPPGAGKTTVVPLVLMDQPWAEGGKILVLEPRRLAARAAASRMAMGLGESVGHTVGYRVRFESRVSARTRVEVVTEGVFTRMLLDDPGLEGVAAVVFDEFHERSLDADLGLALARDAQSVLREDLRLVVMSATLDGARIARLLDDAPIIESQGRMHPVETRYLGRDAREPIDAAVARAVEQALREEEGSILAFLPGQGEIARTHRRLNDRIGDRAVRIAPLYGALETDAQDEAIAPPPAGLRKVVLATSIAETSLTIEGVRVVIDCGLSRIPRFDPASDLTRLATVRVSRASADQRRGRAGRLGPGVCYRLWDEPETRALPPFARPEILDTDLSGLALNLAAWGAKSPESLAFLDPPPKPAFAKARDVLVDIGALDAAGELNAHGRAISGLPLAPRLAHMLIMGAAAGHAERGAMVAAVLSERGLGGSDADLRERLERFASDRSPRAAAARGQALQWARSATRLAPGRSRTPEGDAGMLLAQAFPERIARARGKPGEFRLVSGRGVFVDAADPISRASWLAVGELGGGAQRDRVLLAAPLDEAAVLDAFADRIRVEEQIEQDPRGKMVGVRRRRLGEIVIDERIIDKPSAELIAAALEAEVSRAGLGALGWGERATGLRARVAFLRSLEEGWPDFSDEALLGRVDEWLSPLLSGRTAFDDITDGELAEAVSGLLDWEQRRRLDIEAPERFEAPTGSRLIIDYGAPNGPLVEARVQELFGLNTHPSIAGGRAPLTLSLLSPARRPIQTTRDLPGFWRGSWADVRKDMRGRYPRHEWPEAPGQAAPTTRAKPRVFNR